MLSRRSENRDGKEDSLGKERVIMGRFLIASIMDSLRFVWRHCEPFASCHSERSEESYYFARGKHREGRYDPRPFAPRNDCFIETISMVGGTA
jgi:hypothetical protein